MIDTVVAGQGALASGATFTGSGAPSNLPGQVAKDLYEDSATGDYYELGSDGVTWTKLNTHALASWPIFSASFNAQSNSYQQILPSQFVILNLPTVMVDNKSGWNASTNLYTVPQDGIYNLCGKLRLEDSFGPAALSYGLGVDTALQDSPSFQWGSAFPIPSGGGPSRNGLLNFRIMQLAAGDQIRLFAYIDGSETAYGTTGNPNIQSCELDLYRMR